jgi:glyoxylase-like metal-dependent hydrolase (beta-lactamase superfamily II)
MEISPNVHRIDGRASNLYLCQDEDGLTLIDSGLPERRHLVFDAIKRLRRHPSALVRILATHADLDHAGSATHVQAQAP